MNEEKEQTYEVEVEQTFYRTVRVTAGSQEEAEQIATDESNAETVVYFDHNGFDTTVRYSKEVEA